MYHFGYGSNLNLEFLRGYCPGAQFVMRAYLPNYEVQFRFWSERRKGGREVVGEDSLGEGEVIGGGDLDVEVGAGDDGDGVAQVLDGLGVVGDVKAVSLGRRVGIDDELAAEDLRGLGAPQVAAVHGLDDPPLGVCLLQGAVDGVGQDGRPGDGYA